MSLYIAYDIQLWCVDTVLPHRHQGLGLQYLIEWKDYDVADAT